MLDQPGYLPMSLEELETAVVAACTMHREQNLQNDDYRACVNIGTKYFVKFGARRNLEPERATQEFLFTHAQQSNSPDVPRIAKIVHHFVGQGTGTMYLVKEHIRLQESPPDLDTRIINAIKWLSDVPLPSKYTLGPVGAGCIHHKFFKDFQAPFDIPDVEVLDQYIKKAYGMLSVTARQRVPLVGICGERLMFTQSNMDHSNFGVDEHGRTVLMHFSGIGLLPETFVAFTLCTTDKRDAIAASLGLTDNSKLNSLAAITHCLWMTSDPKFGMAMKRSHC